MYNCQQSHTYSVVVTKMMKEIHAPVFPKKHLEATYTKSSDSSPECPTYKCIIKASIKFKQKYLGLIGSTMHARILNEFVNSDITSSNRAFMDPAQFFYVT